uniref:Protein kinase domain-containing protein n=1 Tax=Nymphaea colorata TaxID=210225 RepID=A0A5K1HNN8_9MAGN|nr:unnamed protein product [Nymphaea colorata]
MYAIKTIMVNRLYLDSIEEEAKNMRMLNSEYVLELVDSFYDDHLGSYVLVTPYYKLGSFEQMMDREWELDELLLFFYQMAKAHFELSKNGICHLDLKP